jgi:hypothetical protein
MKKTVVIYGDTEQSRLLDSTHDSIAFMWAAAKMNPPIAARTFQGLDGWMSNEHMKALSVPSIMRERAEAFVAELHAENRVLRLAALHDVASPGAWEESDGLVYAPSAEDCDESVLVADFVGDNTAAINEQDAANINFVIEAKACMPFLLESGRQMAKMASIQNAGAMTPEEAKALLVEMVGVSRRMAAKFADEASCKLPSSATLRM